MMPSASRKLAPAMAGYSSHFLPYRRIRAYSARMPPSPLLSARSVMITYLTVVCSVSVQIMHDNAPSTSVSLTARSPMMARNV